MHPYGGDDIPKRLAGGDIGVTVHIVTAKNLPYTEVPKTYDTAIVQLGYERRLPRTV